MDSTEDLMNEVNKLREVLLFVKHYITTMSDQGTFEDLYPVLNEVLSSDNH